MTIRSLLAGGLAAALGLASVGANVTGTLPVTSSVVAACQFSISDYNFGNIDMTQLASGMQPTGVTHNLSILCTSGTSAGIVIAGGNGAVPGALGRKMVSQAGDSISYAIIRPNNSQGNPYLANNESIPYTSTNGLTPVLIPIEARFSKADVPSGSYSDIETVTVTF